MKLWLLFFLVVQLTGMALAEDEDMDHSEPCANNEPSVEREDLMLTGISDDSYLILMYPATGVLREDVKIPEGELGYAMRAEFDNGSELLCTVAKVCGKDVVIAFKKNTAPEDPTMISDE